MKKLINKIAYWVWIRTNPNYGQIKRLRAEIDQELKTR